MKYNININQIKSVEWGLSLNEAAILAVIIESPHWSKCLKIGEDDFFLIQTSKIMEELPMISNYPKIYQRAILTLCEKGIIERKFINSWNKEPGYKITSLGKEWFSKEKPKDKTDLDLTNPRTKSTYVKDKIDLDPKTKSTLPYINTNTIDTNTNNNTLASNSPANIESLFSIFWENYPRKILKAKTKKIFLKKDIATAELIVEATKIFAEENKGTEEKYIPMASTYLNQERYFDYEEGIKNKTKKGAETLAVDKLVSKLKKFIDWYLTLDEEKQKKANAMNFDFGEDKNGKVIFSEEEHEILEAVGADLAAYAMLYDEDMIKRQIRGAL